MFRVNKSLPQEVKSFLEEITERTIGYDVYLGGGYLRDMWWNENNVQGLQNSNGCWYGLTQCKTPKDLDIFFIPQSGVQTKELPVLPKTYINYDIKAENIPNVRENVDRVRGMFVPKLTTKDVQFIIYDKPLTMKQLAEDMDIDINQAMYCTTTLFSYCTNNFYNAHEDKIFTIRHKFDTERMYDRLKRMQNKFPDYIMNHNISQEDWDAFEYKNSKTPRKSSGGSFID